MRLLLTPAVKLMQRLRLLPKFVLVTCIFTVPLMLVTGLLFHELDKSIAFTKREQIGVGYIRQVQDLIRITQQHRALRHMLLSGNANLKDKTVQKQAEINARFAALDAAQQTAASLGAQDAWHNIKQAWSALQGKLQNTKVTDSYADHTALIGQLYQLNTLAADRSNLTLDPEVDTYYLIAAFVKTFPEIAEGISEIAGRGAAYIDTGLLEANEDVMLNSDVMVAHRDLARIPVQIATMLHENPSLKQRLQAQLHAVPAAVAFLERAKSEVLSAYNQTSGNQFFEAGSNSVDGLYTFADSSALLLDELLQQRLARDIFKRNLMMGGVLLSLLVAAYLLAGFGASLSSDLKQLVGAVGKTTSGDLTAQMSSHSTDEIGQLLNAFGGMNAGLIGIVAEVRTSTEAIAIASQEITSGNADLSSRTEQQANSLGETSASMAQLTATVQQNANHAQQANRLALSASQVALKGGAAMSQVVGTMASITESARKISDIISVIDNIAFQTNILALNAAVEAARAGGQGKGFAVVATEVRNLAQRSAAAAKEIKLLIADSADRVNVGSRQVDQAGQTMDEIVASVKLVTGIMQQITTASEEQRRGIEHINQAVGQMDNITQQNAALVEQAAAAAESMRDQALRLSQAVSVFKTAESESSVSMARPAAPLGSDNVLPLPDAPAANMNAQPAQRIRRFAIADACNQECEELSA
jgi:methyl-accepting chemotaxis protein